MRIDLIGKRHPLSPTDFGPVMALPAAIAAFGGGTAAATAGAGAAAAAASTGIAASAAASSASLFSTLALTGAATGGAISAYGAYQQGQAQKNMMNYQAQAAAVQQKIVQQTAQANISGVQDQASRESAQLSRQQMAIKGAQAAASGAQGLGSSVTGADIAKDTFTKQQLDQMTLQYNANVKSWNITNNMNANLWGLGAQKDQYSMGAENAEIAGDIGAASSLFGSAAQIGTIGTINRTQGLIYG